MSSPISIVALRLLLEGIKKRSLSQAIAQSGIPRRTAGRHIANLRRFFGDRLFDGDRPTPAALKIKPLLKSLVDSYLEVTSVGPFDPSASTLHVKIGLIGADTEYLASELTELALLKAPAVRLEFVHIIGDRFEALRDRLVDFVICPSEGTIGKPFHRLSLTAGRLVLVCSPDHPLALHQAPLDDKTVTVYSFIDVFIHHPHGRERLLRHEHFPQWIEAASAVKTHFAAALGTSLARHDSLMILPERVAKILEKAQTVKILKTKSDHKPLNYHLIWHESTNSDPSRQWLRSVFSQASRN